MFAEVVETYLSDPLPNPQLDSHSLRVTAFAQEWSVVWLASQLLWDTLRRLIVIDADDCFPPCDLQFMINLDKFEVNMASL